MVMSPGVLIFKCTQCRWASVNYYDSDVLMKPFPQLCPRCGGAVTRKMVGWMRAIMASISLHKKGGMF